MGGLFSSPKTPTPPPAPDPLPKPKPVRLSTATDPDIVDARKKTREAALKRKGRTSTLLTDELLGTATGKKLGA